MTQMTSRNAILARLTIAVALLLRLFNARGEKECVTTMMIITVKARNNDFFRNFRENKIDNRK